MPVPRHWSQKRKYLQGKRGIEKPAFKLPEYIEATGRHCFAPFAARLFLGISMMRQAYHEKEDNKKLKQKAKEKMRPRMGRLDIDYTVRKKRFAKDSRFCLDSP